MNRRGNGGGRGRGGRGQQSQVEYVYSSSLTQNICYDGGKDKISVADELKEGESREINITLTAEKAEQLISVITEAQNDPQGDGGIRLSIYIKETENEKTGEIFDSASIMVLGKFPPKNNSRGGRGASFGRSSGGGRKTYGNSSRRTRDNSDEETGNEAGSNEVSQRSSRGARGRGRGGSGSPDENSRSGRDTSGSGRGRGSSRGCNQHDDDDEYEEVDSPYKKGEDEAQDDIPF